jgi:hypothetical protein
MDMEVGNVIHGEGLYRFAGEKTRGRGGSFFSGSLLFSLTRMGIVE